MTNEQAVIILRRRPQNDGERRVCLEALRTLGRNQVPLWIVQGDALRDLDADELDVYAAAKANAPK